VERIAHATCQFLRRRDLIAVLCGTAALRLGIARAQQPPVPVIGYLSDGSPEPQALADILTPLRKGLAETGYTEGKNVDIEYRWARDQSGRMPALAADLVRRNVALIVATGRVAWETAKRTTDTIPIVASIGIDPVKAGLVASINRPGGNFTGAALFTGGANVLDAKRIELLHELMPKVTVIGILVGPHGPLADAELLKEQTAAEALGLSVRVAQVANDSELDPAFASLTRQGIGALIESPSPFFNRRREAVVLLAAHYALPTIYEWSEYVAAGGLMSYGTSITEISHQLGVYAGRILHGAKPGDLPIVIPDKFRLVINLKTAKTLGLTIPPSLLARADDVIE
jgi:putative tryptophan/tyrosine transport system substrate-binding protein